MHTTRVTILILMGWLIYFSLTINFTYSWWAIVMAAFNIWTFIGTYVTYGGRAYNESCCPYLKSISTTHKSFCGFIIEGISCKYELKHGCLLICAQCI